MNWTCVPKLIFFVPWNSVPENKKPDWFECDNCNNLTVHIMIITNKAWWHRFCIDFCIVKFTMLGAETIQNADDLFKVSRLKKFQNWFVNLMLSSLTNFIENLLKGKHAIYNFILDVDILTCTF